MKRYLLHVVLFHILAGPLLAQQQPAPALSITTNGSQNINLYAGWPLIVNATIMNSLRLSSGSSAATLVIAPPNGAWTSAIQLTALSSSGKSFQWPLQLVGTPDSNSLSLSPTSYVRVVWQMSPGDVTAIPPDTYQLTVTLQVANSSGWNGLVQSRPATIVVGPEPTLTPDQQYEKLLRTAEYDLNAGDATDALNAAQQNLDAQPNDPGALTVMANVLELNGYPEIAFFAANNAVAASYQADPTPIEAPFNLWVMYGRLFNLMGSPGSASATTTLTGSTQGVVFSPASQTVALTAAVSGPSGPIDGGTVTFIVNGVGNPVTSQPVVNGAASAVLTISGGTAAGNYSIQAVYTGTTAFLPSADASQSLTISKAIPALAWNAPLSIPSGTALGPSQLDATASVPGTFVYNPPAGTVLPSGSTQTLSVTFTPADSTDYNSTTASVSVTILGGAYSGSVSPTSATIPVGSSKTFNLTVSSSTFDGAISLSCANPPPGITCQFQPSQLSLSPNGSSATALKVSVTAKPAGLVEAPPAFPSRPWPAPRKLFLVINLVLLAIALRFAIRDFRLAGLGRRRSAALARVSLALVLFASLNVAACVSAQVVGKGPGTNGGGGNSGAAANVVLVIQGASGANSNNLGTVSITVP